MLEKVFVFLFFGFSLLNCCYGSRVVCADGSDSVDTTKLCDYTAHCNDASDELNFDLCKMLHASKCSKKNEIQCLSPLDHYWRNRCTDIITACSLGLKCLTSNSVKICDVVSNGRLKASKFSEPSIPENTKKDDEFYEIIKFIGDAMNETVKRNFSACPPFFTPLDGERCVSLFTPIQVSWMEAKMFCESITGQLAILDDIRSYTKVLQYVEDKGIKSRFWIGGNSLLQKDKKLTKPNSRTWTWLNGKNIKMGAPFWSLYTAGIPGESTQCQDTERKLMPRFGNEAETCLAILEENFYYFSDEFCTTKLSPFCITDKI